MNTWVFEGVIEMSDIYEKLAERIGMANSELIKKLFSEIAGEDEAKLMLSMPATFEGLCDSHPEYSREKINEMLGVLFRKGLVFKKESPQGTLYRMCRDLMQFHDASILWPEAPRSFLDLWQEFMETEWPSFSEVVQNILPKPVTRIVPVSEAIDSRQRILSYEDTRKMVENAGKIAVTKCTCRLTARKCDRPVEICLQLGKAASYAIERGTGREIGVEEALSLLSLAEEVGLIHTTMNRSEGSHFICNCCNDCCMIFPMLINRKLNMCDPSRFVARINEDLCNGCYSCVERCFFDAIAVEEDSSKAVVHEELCMGCGLCRVECPESAISLFEVRSPDFIPT